MAASLTVSVASLLVSSLALLISAGTFAANVLIHVDDLKLMVTEAPSITGNREEVTIHTGSLMTFLNMGRRPISITSIDLIVDEIDDTGKPLSARTVAKFEVQPFIVDAGKIVTKGMSTSPSILTIKPSNANGGETMKLLVGVWLTTSDGTMRVNTDLHAGLPIPTSGASLALTLNVMPREGAATLAAAQSLYHRRRFGFPW
jgi:hypothetical protein